MEKGQCFTFRFPDGDVKGYFFTGELDRNGNYVMCEMLPLHEISMCSFWRMNKTYFDSNLKSGVIELI